MAGIGGDGREQLRATVHGLVQGVGFRWHVVRLSARLGLVGWVANRPDGSVEIVAEGPRQSLDLLEADLRRGPPGAMVDRVEVQRGPASGSFPAFAARSGSHPGD